MIPPFKGYIQFSGCDYSQNCIALLSVQLIHHLNPSSDSVVSLTHQKCASCPCVLFWYFMATVRHCVGSCVKMKL